MVGYNAIPQELVSVILSRYRSRLVQENLLFVDRHIGLLEEILNGDKNSEILQQNLDKSLLKQMMGEKVGTRAYRAFYNYHARMLRQKDPTLEEVEKPKNKDVLELYERAVSRLKTRIDNFNRGLATNAGIKSYLALERYLMAIGLIKEPEFEHELQKYKSREPVARVLEQMSPS